MNIGIHGIGIFLPENVRKNDWWPEHIVSSWKAEKQVRNLARAEKERADPVSPGAQVVFDLMAKLASDPFKGALERRVMPPGMLSSDMEVAAAEEAIARSGIDRSKIDCLLTFSQLPDQLVVPNTTRLHDRLGLPKKCFSVCTEVACNAFIDQLAIAEQMIKAGRCHYALLIQSSGVLHLTPMEEPHSAWFGDGATAVIVGPVGQGRGILGASHYTDGSFHEALVGGCRGKKWFEGDHFEMYVKDRDAARRMLMVIADNAKTTVDEALDEAGIAHDDVDFYATHQSTHWFRQSTQDYIGLKNARSFDSFPWTSGLGPCNVPFMLGMGEREGLLHADDVTALHTGGGGVIYSGMVLRWGT